MHKFKLIIFWIAIVLLPNSLNTMLAALLEKQESNKEYFSFKQKTEIGNTAAQEISKT